MRNSTIAELFQAKPEYLAVPELKILVLYENLEAQKRAVELCHRLAAPQRTGMVVHPNLWELQELEDPRLSRHVTWEAAESHLIIIAFSASYGFNSNLELWLAKLSVVRGNAARALVALTGEDSCASESEKILKVMQEAALRAGMDFFSHSSAAKPRSTAACFIPLSSTSPRRRGFDDRPREGWGINE
jgi:hypothetical protein